MLPVLLKFTRYAGLPLRLRKKVGGLLPLPAQHDFTVRFFNGHYAGRTGNLIDNKMYLYGRHEAATLRLIRLLQDQTRAAGKKAVYVDVGVNSGVHLLCGAQVSDAAYGFEPWPAILEVARRNAELNRLHHVTLFPFGLSDADETLPYLPPVGRNLGVGAFVKGSAQEQQQTMAIAGTSLEQAIPLEVRVGDKVLQEQGIVPTLIKIDTEGFERRVLSGLTQTLAQARPAVIFEYGEATGHDLPTVADVAALFPAHYRFYGILRSREYPVLRPFTPTKRFENVLAWPTERGENPPGA